MSKRPTCTECGSSDVKADAWAEWDDKTGQWVLSQTFPDTAHCEDCGGECSLDWDDADPDYDDNGNLRAGVDH